MSLQEISILLTIASLSLYLLYRWALPKPLPGIPYDKHAAKSIWGNVPEVIAYKKQHGQIRPWFAQHAARHNSAITQVWLAPFSKSTIILSDYQEAQDLFLRRGKEFHRGPRNGDAFQFTIPEHHIAMLSSDKRFKGNKELVRDLMTPGFLHDVSASQIYAKSVMLVELWTIKTKLTRGEPFEALHDIFEAATDMINSAAFAFGDNMSTIKLQLDFLNTSNGAGTRFTPSLDTNGGFKFPQMPELPGIAACRALVEHVGVLFNVPMPKLEDGWRMMTNSHLRNSVKRKNEMIRAEIEKSIRRLEQGDGTMLSAVDHLLQREQAAAQKAGRKPDYHSRKIYDELLGYVVAGHETSATALSWIVKLITTHQAVQPRLRTALHTTYASAYASFRHPTASEIVAKTPAYLDAVIEESLRYAPPIPLLMRSAMVDTTLLGCFIPKGTNVFMPAVGPGYTAPAIPVGDSVRTESSRKKGWGGHWDEGDMHLFRPERWLEVDEVTGEERFNSQAGPMITFGLGPRSCFGKRLAYLELRMMVALLVWKFEFKEVREELTSDEADEAITTTPKYCYVALQSVS